MPLWTQVRKGGSKAVMCNMERKCRIVILATIILCLSIHPQRSHPTLRTLVTSCAGGGVVLAGYWFHTESSFDSRWGAKLHTVKEFLDVNQQAGWNLTFTPQAALPTAPLVTFNASERWHPILLVGGSSVGYCVGMFEAQGKTAPMGMGEQ